MTALVYPPDWQEWVNLPNMWHTKHPVHVVDPPTYHNSFAEFIKRIDVLMTSLHTLHLGPDQLYGSSEPLYRAKLQWRERQLRHYPMSKNWIVKITPEHLLMHLQNKRYLPLDFMHMPPDFELPKLNVHFLVSSLKDKTVRMTLVQYLELLIRLDGVVYLHVLYVAFTEGMKAYGLTLMNYLLHPYVTYFVDRLHLFKPFYYHDLVRDIVKGTYGYTIFPVMNTEAESSPKVLFQLIMVPFVEWFVRHPLFQAWKEEHTTDFTAQLETAFKIYGRMMFVWVQMHRVPTPHTPSEQLQVFSWMMEAVEYPIRSASPEQLATIFKQMALYTETAAMTWGELEVVRTALLQKARSYKQDMVVVQMLSLVCTSHSYHQWKVIVQKLRDEEFLSDHLACVAYKYMRMVLDHQYEYQSEMPEVASDVGLEDTPQQTLRTEEHRKAVANQIRKQQDEVRKIMINALAPRHRDWEKATTAVQRQKIKDTMAASMNLNKTLNILFPPGVPRPVAAKAIAESVKRLIEALEGTDDMLFLVNLSAVRFLFNQPLYQNALKLVAALEDVVGEEVIQGCQASSSPCDPPLLSYTSLRWMQHWFNNRKECKQYTSGLTDVIDLPKMFCSKCVAKYHEVCDQAIGKCKPNEVDHNNAVMHQVSSCIRMRMMYNHHCAEHLDAGHTTQLKNKEQVLKNCYEKM